MDIQDYAMITNVWLEIRTFRVDTIREQIL